MIPKDELLEQLKKMQAWKKSKSFYAEQLGVSLEELEGLLKELNQKKQDKSMVLEDYLKEVKDEIIEFPEEISDKQLIGEEQDGKEKKIVAIWSEKPASPKEIEEAHQIDTDVWHLEAFFSKWDGKKWQVTAKFKLKDEPKFNILEQKDIILKEFKRISPVRYLPIEKKPEKNKLLEISIFDPHFGKLAWAEETGDDYDIEIAEKRYKDAISFLLSQVDLSQVERIHIPLGNDLFNFDTIGNTTTAGTPQDSDSRFAKMVKVVKRVMIETIDYLVKIAPVDVTIIPGNHDLHTTFMLGEILDAYYHNHRNVTINNSPKTRKFYEFGANSFMYTHGNDEKHTDLPLIFATEKPMLWGSSKHRYIKIGHFHKNKKVDYISLDENRGIQLQILPSLSGADYWHYKKGYLSNKQAKAFLYDPERGEIANFTYTA